MQNFSVHLQTCATYIKVYVYMYTDKHTSVFKNIWPLVTTFSLIGKFGNTLLPNIVSSYNAFIESTSSLNDMCTGEFGPLY